MHKTIFAAAALAVAFGFGAAAPAEEKGEWVGLAVLVKTASNTVPVPGREGHSVRLYEYDGVVFNDEGESFLDKARYQVVYVGDSGGMINGGYKTFTQDADSQVVARFQGTGGTAPTFTGTWQFIAGTGRYAGITGNGTWTLTYVSDTTAWDVLEGDYKIP